MRTGLGAVGDRNNWYVGINTPSMLIIRCIQLGSWPASTATNSKVLKKKSQLRKVGWYNCVGRRPIGASSWWTSVQRKQNNLL